MTNTPRNRGGRPRTHRMTGVDPADITVALEPVDDRHWSQRAACAGEPSSTFFPDDAADPSRAIALCAVCPVRDDCLRDAAVLESPAYVFGIRAGLRPSTRRRLWQAVARARRRGIAGAVQLDMFPADTSPLHVVTNRV